MSNLTIKYTIFSTFIIGLLLFSSCSKDSNSTTSTGSLSFEFEAMANGTEFELNKAYTNSINSESISFSLFQYYVSNIVLTKTDGSQYIVPKNESYFLVKHNGISNPIISLKNIPTGDYNAVSFMVGVDTSTNLLDPTTLPAALDVSNDMHWSWSQGYVFLKSEGTVNGSTGFKYHLGLNSNLKTLNLVSTAGNATVRTNITPTIHFAAEVMNLFNGISIVSKPIAMGGTALTPPSNNIPSVFSLEHIHN